MICTQANKPDLVAGFLDSLRRCAAKCGGDRLANSGQLLDEVGIESHSLLSPDGPPHCRSNSGSLHDLVSGVKDSIFRAISSMSNSSASLDRLIVLGVSAFAAGWMLRGFISSFKV